MAAFIHKFDPSVGVIANDIGVISCYDNLRLLDLFGLASRRVLDLKRSNNFNKAEIEALALQKKMQMAIVYDYPEIIPDSWTKIGEWTIHHNVVCANNTVAVYSVGNAGDRKRIINSFNSYVRRLPANVRYKSYFP